MATVVKMAKLSKPWTWTSVTQSIDFPAGIDVPLTPEQEAAAITAGVLEKADGDEGVAKAGAKGRARPAQA